MGHPHFDAPAPLPAADQPQREFLSPLCFVQSERGERVWGLAPNLLVYKRLCLPPQARIADAEHSDLLQLLLGLFLLRHLQFFPPFWGGSLTYKVLTGRLVSVGRLWAFSLGYCIFFPLNLS